MTITVEQLIEKLQKLKKDSKVFISYNDYSLGCSTCGYGSDIEADVGEIVDLETKVIINVG